MRNTETCVIFSDLGMGGDEARKLETRVFLGRLELGSYRVEIHKIGVERGVSWEDAFAIWKDHHDEGVCVSLFFR